MAFRPVSSLEGMGRMRSDGIGRVQHSGCSFSASDSGGYSSSANFTASSDLSHSLAPAPTSQSTQDTKHDDPRSKPSSECF